MPKIDYIDNLPDININDDLPGFFEKKDNKNGIDIYHMICKNIS